MQNLVCSPVAASGVAKEGVVRVGHRGIPAHPADFGADAASS